MDPADERPVRSAIEIQGAMLGKHEQELAAAHQAVKSLSAQVADLSARLLHLHQESAMSHNRQLPSEPRVNNPSCYAGEPTECRAFLIQCEVVFSLQPQTYAEDRAGIAYVLSLSSWDEHASGVRQFGKRNLHAAASTLFSRMR